MTTLFDAVNATARTENGAKAFHSTLDLCVDYFFKAGASRGKNISRDFIKAFSQEPEIATRILLWLRDVRGGAGERQQFKDGVTALINFSHAEVARAVMNKIPELGRFDDLMVFWGTELESEAVALWVSALDSGNGLAFKWAPRKDKKGAKPLRKALGLKEADWRKLCVANTDVVEQHMCAKNWSKINYEHVPSLASARYQSAFARNDNERYGAYLQSLEKGDAKINAGAVYPYDVVLSLKTGKRQAANAQWDALPNYLEGVDERFLPMVDVSGSMGVSAGGSRNVTALDVAVSLGLYLAERNESVFKDTFLTFSSKPKLSKLTGDDLYTRYNTMVRAEWGMSTDIAKAFDLILNAAVQGNVPQEQMPTKLLILSDMQFNQCVRAFSGDRWGYGAKPADETAFDYAKAKYREAGYNMPQVVFWNIADRGGNIPVTVGTAGTALVSGFSPAIVKSLLGGELEPRKVMLDTVMKDRYNV